MVLCSWFGVVVALVLVHDVHGIAVAPPHLFHRHGRDRSDSACGVCPVGVTVVQQGFSLISGPAQTYTLRVSFRTVPATGAVSSTFVLSGSTGVVLIGASSRNATCVMREAMLVCPLRMDAGQASAVFDVSFTTSDALWPDTVSHVASAFTVVTLQGCARNVFGFSATRAQHLCKKRLLCAPAPAPTPSYSSWAALCADQPACCNTTSALDCVIGAATVIVDAGDITAPFVHIVQGGSLVFREAANCSNIVFRARSILVESGGLLEAGTVDAPFGATGGCTLTIGLYGDGGGTGITCVTPGCGQPAPADGSALVTLPCADGASSYRDYYYGYGSLYGASQQGAFGTKVLAVAYNGSLSMHGAWGTGGGADGGSGMQSWQRVAGPLNRGATSLRVSDASRLSSWPRDTPLQVVLTSTDYLATHSELLTVVYPSTGAPDVLTLTGATQLQWHHHGDVLNLTATGSNLRIRSADLRAAVGLLSRSITVQSLGDTATDVLRNQMGGHTLVRQGFRRYTVAGVLFDRLGQGGTKARYPVSHRCAVWSWTLMDVRARARRFTTTWRA